MISLPPGTDLSTIPLVAPPPGMSSNFVDPESLANTIMAIGILMLVLTAFVVIVRLFTNYYGTRGLGLDDCCSVIAIALLLIYVVVTLESRRFARHNYDIPLSWITPSSLKINFVQNIIWGPMVFFAKSSLFMLYYRVFRIKKSIRYAIIFGIILSFLNSFLIMTADAILCSPKVGDPWNFTTVVNMAGLSLFAFVCAIINLILDIFLFVLPIPVILKLQLSVKKKIWILAIYMAGLFALVASILTLVIRIKFWQGTDKTWNGYLSAIFTTIETGVTILCGCTSALFTFWKSYIATHVALLYSRLCFRSRTLATRFKVVSKTSSSKQIYPPEPVQSKQYPTLYNLNYVELDEHYQESAVLPGSIVRTTVGSGSPRSDVETGVIRKFTKLEQSFN